MEKRTLKENQCQITNSLFEIGTTCQQCVYVSGEERIKKLTLY